ncbi:MAG: hypothetical protein GJT30_18220 [Geobacter sp.]|nr:hypothetical protein [Geobacter sp.]
MKKSLVMLSALVFMSAPAYAEQKLLITDVLDLGQSEVSTAISYNYSSYDFSDNAKIYPSGTARINTTSASCSAATGLGHGLQISASIPYLLSQNSSYKFETTPASSVSSKRDGLGDLTVGARYRMVDEETAPVTLVTGLDLKFDMEDSDHGGTGTTNVSPYLALSSKASPNTRVYAYYAAVLRNHGASDTHAIMAGVEQGITNRVTAVVEAGVNFLTNNDHLKNTDEYGINLATYLQMYGNLYLIPSIGVSVAGSFDRKDSTTHYGPTHSAGGALALYYLF